ncbi:hypothetical protein BKA69DRAFT_1042112 [Paraphysoderma sedebokerense]|nr:hypothetical protein BKA69DRAFT_1042112 [Paraphysoderma sedebokerense]
MPSFTALLLAVLAISQVNLVSAASKPGNSLILSGPFLADDSINVTGKRHRSHRRQKPNTPVVPFIIRLPGVIQSHVESKESIYSPSYTYGLQSTVYGPKLDYIQDGFWGKGIGNEGVSSYANGLRRFRVTHM